LPVFVSFIVQVFYPMMMVMLLLLLMFDFPDVARFKSSCYAGVPPGQSIASEVKRNGELC
jgi:hypothetical protein